MNTNSPLHNGLFAARGEKQLRFLSAETVAAIPPAEMLVKAVLPREGLAAVYGPSRSGKTFLTMDLMMAVSTGGVWFGRKSQKTRVLYICLEGAAGLSKRVKAYLMVRGTAGSNLKFMIEQWDLGNPADVDLLIATAQEEQMNGGVVVIDTMNRASPGADENSGKDMGQLIEACTLIQRELGGLVLLVHHTGKDISRGLRGHSSLFAALDAAIELKREGDRRSWRVEKQKDGSEGEPVYFRLESVELGVDEDGDPITSCVVVSDESPSEATRSKRPRGGNQAIIFDALGEYIKAHGASGVGPVPITKYAVKLEDAVQAIAPSLPCEPKRRVERTRAALTALIANGFCVLREGWVWIK